MLDPTTERWYYYNVHTQESQWAEDVVYPEPQLQGGGEAHMPETWGFSSDVTVTEGEHTQYMQPLADHDYSESSLSLPAHITAAFDDTAQSWYYVNQWTGVSTWEYHPEQPPQELQPQELQPQPQPARPGFTTPAEPHAPLPSPIVMTTRVSVLQHPSSSVGVTTLYPEPMLEA